MAYEFTPKRDMPSLNRRAGRTSTYETLAPQTVKMMTDRLLRRGLSQHAWQVIELLASGGILSSQQLGFLVAPSTLDDYTRKGKRFLYRLPIAPAELSTVFESYGLDGGDEPRLYVLGQIGVELATMRLGQSPVTGHLAYSLNRIMHDVILNEIILRLFNLADDAGWAVIWKGTNDGALYNTDHSRKVLEPDALLILEKDGMETLHFCIEYHNEDKRTRAERKVDKYASVFANNENLWRYQWETYTFPRVLTVFSKRIVGEGYRDRLAESPCKVQFYGKLLSSVLQDKLEEWLNLNTRKREKILEI